MTMFASDSCETSPTLALTKIEQRVLRGAGWDLLCALSKRLRPTRPAGKHISWRCGSVK